MKFIENSLVILPIDFHWEDNPLISMCDFHTQTARVLAKNNIVVFLISKSSIPARSLFSNQRILSMHSHNTYVLRQIQLPKYLPGTFQNKINDLLSRCVYRYLEDKHKLKRKLLWIFEPTNGHLFDNPFYRSITSIYDCIDAWSFSWNIETDSFLFDLEKKVINFSSIIFVNSKALKSLYRIETHLVPQGFRYQFFKRSPFESKIKNARFQIGFIGNIQKGDRIDWHLLSSVASKMPQVDFIFYGMKKNLFRKKYKKIITHNKNILLFDSVPHNKIPEVVDSFDACMIPYIVDGDQAFPSMFNKYCYPMKIFEYLYLGKPVISTRIASLENLSRLIYLGNNDQDWIMHIKSIMVNKVTLRQKIQARRLARSQSWEKKIEKIDSVIAKYFS